MRAERVTDPVDQVGESPVWRARDESLYWVDIAGKRIHRLHLSTGRRESWTTEEQVACIAFARDGTLVAGMESGIFSLRLSARGGRIEANRLAAPDFPMSGMRFNDGRCDRQGRFWAGTMHTDMQAAHAVGSLYRYTDETGLSPPFAGELLTQNGLAFSPEGDLMYLSDSHPKARVVWVYDYDAVNATPSNRRVFVDMTRHPGRPDGAAVDADGCYWTCANDAGQVLRFTPKGALDRALGLPAMKPSMCAFGGARLDTLYVTTIRPQKPGDMAEPHAGAVFALHPGVQGLAETEFQRRTP